jgi:hypothetical protein
MAELLLICNCEFSGKLRNYFFKTTKSEMEFFDRISFYKRKFFMRSNLEIITRLLLAVKTLENICLTSKCCVNAPKYHKLQRIDMPMVCFSLASKKLWFMKCHSTKVPNIWLKIFKIFIRKRCNYRIYVIYECTMMLEVVSVKTTTICLQQKHHLLITVGIISSRQLKPFF